jgi:hypothetical protein
MCLINCYLSRFKIYNNEILFRDFIIFHTNLGLTVKSSKILFYSIHLYLAIPFSIFLFINLPLCHQVVYEVEIFSTLDTTWN